MKKIKNLKLLFGIFLVFTICLTFTSAFDEFEIICGGGDEFQILCIGGDEFGAGGGQTFVLDIIPPTLTINFPDGSDIRTPTTLLRVTLNEAGSCNYSINDVSNITLPVRSGNVFETTITTPSNGINLFTFYCNDTTGNLATASVTSNIRQAVSIPEGGEVTGSGQSIIKNVTLFHDDWIRGRENILFANIFGINGNLTPVSEIDFILENVEHDLEVERLSIGVYRAKFFILDNVSEVTIRVVAKQSFRTREAEITIPIGELTFLSKVKRGFSIRLDRLIDLLDDPLIRTIFIIFLIILISVIISVIVSRKKKK